ncbi:MAG: L-alanine exporter AlaE [Candidatus Nitrosocaldaceae archaeon]
MKSNKKYIIDSLASILFWVPLYILFNYFVLKLDIWQILAMAAFSATINLIFGGLFGKFLDRWRRLFNI